MLFRSPERKKAKTAETLQILSTQRKLPAAFPKTPQSAASGRASSSRVTLDVQTSVHHSEDSQQADSTDDAEAEAMLVADDSRSQTSTSASEASSLPFTPQRPKRSTLFPKTPGEFDVTPNVRKQRRVAAMIEENGMDDEDASDDNESQLEDDAPFQKRYRPVFLGHRQWVQRDPRFERDREAAQRLKRGMVKKYGHPFEHLRPSAIIS